MKHVRPAFLAAALALGPAGSSSAAAPATARD